MNHARTTYQSDYTPFGWMQNNFMSDMNEFCSPENVDECLKYISQEFCALGYPSIYSDSSDCPFSVNCDIIKFLNVTYELLRRNSDCVRTKEDLEDRYQRLNSDLNAFSKRNSQLKNALENTERKLAGALERERQLKEKNEQLLQLLKNEKEDNKKLSAQLRQQKVAYQHEIRKYENNMNHIKAKLNQILSDKNPNKKIASISTSHNLPRNTGKRGMWKTDTVVTSALEEMYNSVISSYETRCSNMSRELGALRQCLDSVLLQLLENISDLQKEGSTNCSQTSICNDFFLSDIKSASRNVTTFEDKFKCLLSVWKEIASGKTQETCRNLENKLAVLQSKVSEYDKVLKKNENSSQVDGTQVCKNMEIDKENMAKSLAEEYIKKEKLKLEEEKLTLSKTLEDIEKEKAHIAAQKIAILRLTAQQKTAQSSWNQTLNTLPAISVITSRNGENKIVTPNQLKPTFSSPDSIGNESFGLTPEWKSSGGVFSKSDTALLSESGSAAESPVFFSPTLPSSFSNSDLPSWAVNESEVGNFSANSTLEVSQCPSADEVEITRDSSSEEFNLLRLRAAMEDIEKRRVNTVS